MEKIVHSPLHGIDENTALRTILEGTATKTGSK